MNNNSYCIAPTGGTIAIPSDTASCAAEETQRRTFNSTLDGLRKIARNEGLSTLWRGLSPTLAMAIPANVIYFTGYDFLRYSSSSPFVSSDSHMSVPVSSSYLPLVAGSFARVFGATAISPIEMFRTRLQATSVTSPSSSPFAQTLYGLRDMVRTDGARSLWRGLSLTLWRDVPFSGLYWWGYESIFHYLQSTAPNSTTHASTFTSSFAAGCLSGAAATIVTMPFDVGKTRQQTFFHAPSNKDALVSAAEKTKGLAPEELSIPRFLLHIYRGEGLGGLWKGWAARLMKVSPACGIMIASYEVGKVIARARNQKVKAEDDESST
jgi:solute carrier family 25 protein 39/40